MSYPYQFYNELSKMLTQFKEACKMWARERSQELQCVCYHESD